jgi:hypothetical protein
MRLVRGVQAWLYTTLLGILLVLLVVSAATIFMAHSFWEAYRLEHMKRGWPRVWKRWYRMRLLRSQRRRMLTAQEYRFLGA